MPEFLLPFGPYHIVLLHLPIGVLSAIWFVELFLKNDGGKRNNHAIALLHALLLLTCGLTIILGLSYEEFGKYGDEIEDHEFWGYVFGACVLATYIFYWIHRKAGKALTRSLYVGLLMLSTIAMTITGHHGGQLVHGKGFLTKPFKEKTRALKTPVQTASTSVTPAKEIPTTSRLDEPSTNPTSAMDTPIEMMDEMSSAVTVATKEPEPAPGAEANDVALFEDARAIFKRHCFECHGATKQKGDFRIDLEHLAYIGGKSELAAIVPGDLDKSAIVYRIHLPRDDDDAMPPEKKDPISSADIETIEKWIAAGAFWPTEKEVIAASNEYVEIGDTNTDALITKIGATGAKAEYNAWGDDSVRVDLSVAEPGQLETALKELKTFRSKLAWLDASNLELPESFYQELTEYQNLQRLHLDGTNVTDAQLQQLSNLPKLTYLNLYNTKIGDQGAAALKACTHLQQVYLTATEVTSKGITELKTSNPELELIHQ
jgi:mono/diheme cytochrome c family protein